MVAGLCKAPTHMLHMHNAKTVQQCSGGKDGGRQGTPLHHMNTTASPHEGLARSCCNQPTSLPSFPSPTPPSCAAFPPSLPPPFPHFLLISLQSLCPPVTAQRALRGPAEGFFSALQFMSYEEQRQQWQDCDGEDEAGE